MKKPLPEHLKQLPKQTIDMVELLTAADMLTQQISDNVSHIMILSDNQRVPISTQFLYDSIIKKVKTVDTLNDAVQRLILGQIK